MTMGLWQIIASTDLATKGILLILFGMSVVCWALTIYKKMIISAKIKGLKQAQGLLQNVKGIDDLFARASIIQNSFSGELMMSFLKDFEKFLKIGESETTPITDKDWYLFQGAVNQRIDEALNEEDALIPVLSTSAQAAPLIGLFGTVWGLIHAFMGIAEQKSADISAVAPGIAEALVATMGGLVIAIPALIMYNYLNGSLKKLEEEVIRFSDTMLWVIRGMLPPQNTSIKASFVGKPVQQAPQETSL